MLVHRNSPADMLKGFMIPIPKNRKSSVNTSDNFRAICLQSVICKILDLMMIVRDGEKLQTSKLQFGYKSELSASIATSVVCETVDYYLNNGGQVYALALDATKAFDRVNLYKLFKILLRRKVNGLYLRLLFDMYVNQRLCISFSGSKSRWFSVTNGVKQGGVLSPVLFSVYVDNLLNTLESEGYGCNVGGKYCGIVAYADDIILLSPTQYALQRMISICEEYSADHSIKFNGSKSQLIIFGNDCYPCISVNGEIVKVVNEINYLGHVISRDRSAPMVHDAIKDFNGKFNAFIGDFSSVTSTVKNSLFKQYCCSFYGFQNCALYSRQFDRLVVTVRKAQRKLWNISNMCHKRFLPIITEMLPVDVYLHKRFVKYFVNCLRHKNKTVSSLFLNSIYCDSRLGKNLRYVMESYNISVRDLRTKSICQLLKVFHERCVPDENDIRVCTQIKELIHMRDFYNSDMLLHRGEMQDLINYLATA